MNNEADLRNKALAGDAEAQRELGNRYREFDLMITPAEGEDRFEPTLKEAIHSLSLFGHHPEANQCAEVTFLRRALVPSEGRSIVSLCGELER